MAVSEVFLSRWGSVSSAHKQSVLAVWLETAPGFQRCFRRGKTKAALEAGAASRPSATGTHPSTSAREEELS